MTAKQWKMLDLLNRHDREGTIEVTIQFGEYDYGDTPADEEKAWRVACFAARGVVRSLARKGYATDDDDGYGITEEGKALLAKRAARIR